MPFGQAFDLIFDKSDQVPESVTAGLETVAVRMPSHPVARALIKASGVPVAAPSANLSGKPSPTDGAHVVLDLDGRVDAIVCGQSSDVGLESTVLDVTGDVPLILRPGGVTREDIVGVVGACNVDPAIEKVLSKDLKPKSPGMKYTHYAPEADLYVYEGDTDKVTSYIEGLKVKYESQGLKVGIILVMNTCQKYSGGMIKKSWVQIKPVQMASRLFAVLREFDDEKADIILSEAFSKEGIGHALMNRLLKAAGHRVIQL